MCNLDCLNCTYDDCINDGELDNAIRCRSWYERNKEKKKAYQREYQRAYRERKRQNKTQKVETPINEPKEVKIVSFKELGAMVEVLNE